MAIDDSTFLDETEDTIEADEDSSALIRVFDGVKGRVLFECTDLSTPLTVIGRTKGTVLLDDDKRVSRHHAEIIGRKFIQRGSGKSRINGRVVESSTELKYGDVIRMGDNLFVYAHGQPQADGLDSPIIGKSAEAIRLRETIELVASSKTMVLLTGETGVGKDITANSIHASSARKGDFVPVNCGAIPAGLAESQLFGHAKGAFTGANENHPGFFRMAHGGTLFLDEIGELPKELQPKLLRVLDKGEVLALGSAKPVAVDVRIIAATNRDLLKDVQAGHFRGDLYARLAEMIVEIPPLTERREDILLILESVLQDDKTIETNLAEALLIHSWPFNIREVLKVAKELQLRGKKSESYSLSFVRDRIQSVEPSAASIPEPKAFAAAQRPAPPSAEDMTRMLERYHGNISSLARETGRSRTQIRRWLEKYGIDVKPYR